MHRGIHKQKTPGNSGKRKSCHKCTLFRLCKWALPNGHAVEWTLRAGRRRRHLENPNPKYTFFGICSEIGTSRPSHSIRLVKLVSKNSTRAKVDDIFWAKTIYSIKKMETSAKLPNFYRLAQVLCMMHLSS